ncbi:MAG: type II toxin-antitoxin system RelE/ParE family toxin [Alphaproteobacteria bacterium]|nr:type II toxin-antitoxin system RelE/ParE family toxin [Alphaproteobacteria bacterium]
MNTLIAHDVFEAWLNALQDRRGKARILKRLAKAEDGHFGDVKPVGDGVYEMRINFGPGYRIYYTRQDATVYLLLAGGDKSRQARDIALAKRLAANWKE